MTEVEFKVRRQTEAAKLLLVSLHEAGAADDEELRADAIDGETDLNEALAAALAEIDEREILIKGLKAKEGEFAERRDREERSVERIRTLIEQALLTAELPSMKLPTATLSIARRKPGVVVTNEADIPSRFWVIPDPQPKLDKKALADALAANENVPGASLDNGTVSLTIRRK
ncbi:siphovirus Gp157 family protein [Paradevosia shaoguanensis]|uniref:siphovirus Gp157 family protein n=1 Tax=Paradevosia shaoguanensis TaxID=1335043 RepID=UPI0019312761|nr:siphovirus Gp157 family protein [Paradevosia shaoguanensis]